MLLVNKDLHYCISHAKTGTEANAWGCHCTDMHIKPCPPWLPSHAMAFLSLRTNTERISIKSPAGDQYHRQIKLLHFAWNWNRDKKEQDTTECSNWCRSVLPRCQTGSGDAAKWIHKFQSTWFAWHENVGTQKSFTMDVGQMQRRRHHMTAHGL